MAAAHARTTLARAQCKEKNPKTEQIAHTHTHTHTHTLPLSEPVTVINVLCV